MPFWCKKTFEDRFSAEECKLFPTQQHLFDFLDSALGGNRSSSWLPFSIELSSVEDTAHLAPRHCHAALFRTTTESEDAGAGVAPAVQAGAKRCRLALRGDYALLYGAEPLSRQNRFFLACTTTGLHSILDTVSPGELHLYEIIREGSPCHLYLDVECEGNVNVSCEYTCIDSSGEEEDKTPPSSQSSDVVICEKDDTELEDMGGGKGSLPPSSRSSASRRLLKVPSSGGGGANQTYTVSEYDALLACVSPGSIPPHYCPLSCPCVEPCNNDTTDTLLKELYAFVKERYPQLLYKATEQEPTSSNSALPPHYTCWKEVLVMRSTVPHAVRGGHDSVTGPQKFSQHYLIKMHDGKVWRNNASVGGFVREFVDYVSEAASMSSARSGATRVHESLFYHSAVKWWSVPFANTPPSGYHGGSALPFLQRKCVIDCAVYSKNRMMRCLGSSKLGRRAVLQVALNVRDGRDVSDDMTDLMRRKYDGSPSGRKEEAEVISIRLLGVFLNSLIAAGNDGNAAAVIALEGNAHLVKRKEEAGPIVPRKEDCPGDTVAVAVTALSSDAVREIEEQYSKLSGKSCILSAPRQRGACLLYTMQGSRYCQNIRREHKSNGIYVVVDVTRRMWWQKCFDPDCANFRSPYNPLKS